MSTRSPLIVRSRGLIVIQATEYHLPRATKQGAWCQSGLLGMLTDQLDPVGSRPKTVMQDQDRGSAHHSQGAVSARLLLFAESAR